MSISNIKFQADGIEKIIVRKEYNSDDIAAFNQEYVENELQILKIQEEISEMNASKKAVKKLNSNIIEKIKLGYDEQNIEAYYIDDNGLRTYYDNDGVVLKERKLRPNEGKQLRIAVNN